MVLPFLDYNGRLLQHKFQAELSELPETIILNFYKLGIHPLYGGGNIAPCNLCI